MRTVSGIDETKIGRSKEMWMNSEPPRPTVWLLGWIATMFGLLLAGSDGSMVNLAALVGLTLKIIWLVLDPRFGLSSVFTGL